MTPTAFQGCNAIISREDFKDESASKIPAMQLFDTDGKACIVVAFQPSYEDKIAIAEGRPVFIKTYGQTQPALHLFTTDEKGHPNE